MRPPPRTAGRVRTALLRAVAGRRPGRTLARAAVLGLLAFVVFRHALRPAWIEGASMEPTVRDGGLRFINLLAYRRRDPHPGEVVAIGAPGRSVMYLKRVLAAPGDRIAFAAGALRVNGESRPELYVVHTGAWTMAEQTLDAGEFFVAGDNRTAPLRQHAAGRVSRRDIRGKLAW